jgi:integrase
MEKLKLTRTEVEKLRGPDTGQKVYRFREPPGLLLVVGTRTKTFAFQSDTGGTSRRIALGRYPFMSVDTARIRALDLASQVARGRAIAPNPRLSLSAAMEAYLADRKTLAEKTKRYTRSLFDLYLTDWRDKPLASISPTMVLQKHAAIAKRIKEQPRYENSSFSGAATADDVMRKLRVVWNHAAAMDEGLPPNPVRKLSAARAWFKSAPGRSHIAPHQLKDWWQTAQALPNAVHAAYLGLVLFTGMRREEAAALRWVEYNKGEHTIKLAPERTKNRRGHTVFLSPQAQDIIDSMPCEGDYVFPAASASGHIEEPRWGLEWIADKCDISVTVHDLRRTFITVAESCPISPMQLKQLVGHTASDVTETYVMRDPAALRKAAALVGAKLETLCIPPRVLRRAA